jgi:hypothetical protein
MHSPRAVTPCSGRAFTAHANGRREVGSFDERDLGVVLGQGQRLLPLLLVLLALLEEG